MGFFKTSEERDEERRARERQKKLNSSQEEEELRRQEDLEWRKEQEEYIEEIEVDVRRNNTVICYCTDDIDFKQAAMNYLLQKGYVCVQNAVANTSYPPDFILTFVKKEFADSFIVK